MLLRQDAGIKPSHKPVQQYYQALKAYDSRRIRHEGATETAFQRLLNDTAPRVGWMLVPKQRVHLNGDSIYPDGTLRDFFNLPRGYWEAKDKDDNLQAEVRAKVAKGYPLTNTIFEDTQQAILYQGKKEQGRYDLREPQHLTGLLNEFYSYAEPDIQSFERAVEEFKDSVPELAKGLNAKVKEAHRSNPPFKAAFAQFFSLCQTAINPNIRRDAVDEMLVQHLLTERLFRTVFNDPEFTRRNVIAAQVEKVIMALVSPSFSRTEFLKSLDKFYRAIEHAAQGLDDDAEKQAFLNTVYGRFFQGYSVKLADTHGVVYTPQPIVNFICASVVEALRSEFGLSLADPEVLALDPCTGTGNFIVNLLRRVPGRVLPSLYRNRLFANEIMLLPYYIAAVNIERAYYDLTETYEPFEGLCFVDTLDLAERSQFAGMGEENTARVERQGKAPITVIVGNPPYNANQINENDNNKNRKYEFIEGRIRETYAKDSAAQLKNKLYDPYVKFLRWALDRLGDRDGLVCVVTNNSFVVDRHPFDGLRKHFANDFACIYHVDLHGNVRRNPKLSGTTHNVFGIQLGVGITLAVRARHRRGCKIFYHRVPENWRKDEKLAWLERTGSVAKVEWVPIVPDAEHNWVTPSNTEKFANLIPMEDRSPDRIFRKSSTGAKSNRDEVVYGFDREALAGRAERFTEDYNSEVDRYKRARAGTNVDDFVDPESVKWSSTLKGQLVRGRYAEYDPANVRVCLYRPFTKKYLYYDNMLNDRPGIFRFVFPTERAERENRAIYCTNHSQTPFVVQITDCIANEAVGGRAGQCFPFYIYDASGGSRQENITDWSLDLFRQQYGNPKISKWDIFYYAYGLLHHRGYREEFADILRQKSPRLPLAADFAAFSRAGLELAQLHLKYETIEPYPLDYVETRGVPLSYRVEGKMLLSREKTSLRVNESLTLTEIPREVFQYRLGNRSALDWVIEQYQMERDTSGDVVSDPNRDGDEEYITRLVGQVVQVSLKTTAIIDQLPEEFM